MSDFAASFLGVYDGRPIEPGNLVALVKSASQRGRQPGATSRDHAALYGEEFQERARQYHLLRQDRDVLTMVERQYRAGAIEEFRFQGRRHAAAAAPRLLEKFNRLLEQEGRWWADFDRRVFLAHYRMAGDLGEKIAEDLRSRYEFHLTLQNIHNEISRRRRALAKVAAFVSESPEALHYDDFHEVRRCLLDAYDAFERCLATACRVKAPPIRCLPAGQSLAKLLLSKALPRRLRPTAQVLPAGWIYKFQRRLDEVRQNLPPVLLESLAALLAVQGRIARRWTEEMANLPEVEEVEEELEEVCEPSVDLQPLDDEPEFELSDQDVLPAATREVADRSGVKQQEPDDDPEFELSDRDVLAEPEKAGADVEMEDLDPDDRNNRPRHWNM